MNGAIKLITPALINAPLKTNMAATVKVAVLENPLKLFSGSKIPVITNTTIIPIATMSIRIFSVAKSTIATMIITMVLII